jgi:hypothetical protein
VLALVAAVFSGVLSKGLVYDDGKRLLENPFVRNTHLWWRIFTGSVWYTWAVGNVKKEILV